METFTLGVTLFTLIVISLVTLIIFAKSKLVATGDVNITINGEKNHHGAGKWQVATDLGGRKALRAIGVWRRWNLRTVPGKNPLWWRVYPAHGRGAY